MTLFLQANGWTVLLMKIEAKFMLFCRKFNHQGNALYKKIDTDMSLSIFSVVTNYLPYTTTWKIFDWLRAVVFQLNLKYLHVKITNLLWVVV